MVSQLSDKKTWIGSLVISEQSAKTSGYVKEICPSPENEADIVVVSPLPVTWLPRSLTGIFTFSSEDVIGAGDGCLIVSESVDVRFTQQSDFWKTLCQSATALPRTTADMILEVLVILLSLFGSIVSQMPFIGSKLFKKPALHDFFDPSSFGDDNDDNTGLSPMREPKPPGPLPSDHEALALPLVDTQQNTETFPMTQLIVPTITQPDS